MSLGAALHNGVKCFATWTLVSACVAVVTSACFDKEWTGRVASGTQLCAELVVPPLVDQFVWGSIVAAVTTMSRTASGSLGLGGGGGGGDNRRAWDEDLQVDAAAQAY